jgi:hypothetical protein
MNPGLNSAAPGWSAGVVPLRTLVLPYLRIFAVRHEK